MLNVKVIKKIMMLLQLLIQNTCHCGHETLFETVIKVTNLPAEHQPAGPFLIFRFSTQIIRVRKSDGHITTRREEES